MSPMERRSQRIDGVLTPRSKSQSAPKINPTRPDAEGVIEVVSNVPLLNKQRQFRLRGSILECTALKTDRKVAVFDISECEVRPVKETLVIEGKGKTLVIKPLPGEYDKWKYALMQAGTPLLSERARTMRSTPAGSKHLHAFEGLLMQQLAAIQECLEDQVYTADADAVAKTVVGALADPTFLARLNPAKNPTTVRNLVGVWEAYDADHDGAMTAVEFTTLVRGYLEAMRHQLPVTLRHIVATITQFFLQGKEAGEVSRELMSKVNEKILPQAAQFIGAMLNGHPAIAAEMLERMEVVPHGNVHQDVFMERFLLSAEFPYIDSSVCVPLSDEISLQLTKSLGQMWKVRPGLCGLANLGNTCYMNAALQCLSHTADLRKFFLSKKFISSVLSRHKNGAQLTMSFAELIREIWSGQNSTLRPHRFKRAIDEAAKQFAGSSQQDSHEFIAYLLDTVHEDVNLIEKKPRVVVPDSNNRPDAQVSAEAWRAHLLRENSVIVDVFHGQIKSAVKCGECERASVRFDAALGFSLPIPDGQDPVNLDQCMDLFTAEERLEEDNMWFCDQCKKKTPSTKRINLFKLPQCLIIHLKRFKYNVYGTITNKLDNVAQFPVEGWDLRNWLPVELQNNPNCKTVYDLYAIVHHFGTASSGHYTSTCKVGSTWMTFDDSNVMCVPGTGIGSSKSAYVLFYEQRGSRSAYLDIARATAFARRNAIPVSPARSLTSGETQPTFSGSQPSTPLLSSNTAASPRPARSMYSPGRLAAAHPHHPTVPEEQSRHPKGEASRTPPRSGVVHPRGSNVQSPLEPMLLKKGECYVEAW